MKKTYFLLGAFLFIFASCSTGTNVKRVDTAQQLDLSGYWNDTDVRIVCEALINDCLRSPRVDQAIRASRTTPTVIVGRFRNESSEHIDTSIISSIMEAAIFNSGRLDFVAGGDVREDIRAERMDQQTNASPETMAKLRNETGADYMLTGTVRTIVDRDGNQTVRTYFVTSEMTNIETNQRMWIGQNSEIKKLITQPRNRL
jgi:uncharacterized protein (TIGR02722 family)